MNKTLYPRDDIVYMCQEKKEEDNFFWDNFNIIHLLVLNREHFLFDCQLWSRSS